MSTEAGLNFWEVSSVLLEMEKDPGKGRGLVGHPIRWVSATQRTRWKN